MLGDIPAVVPEDAWRFLTPRLLRAAPVLALKTGGGGGGSQVQMASWTPARGEGGRGERERGPAPLIIYKFKKK